MQHDSRPQGWSPQVSDDDYIRFLRGERVLGLNDGNSPGGPESRSTGRRRRRDDAPDAPPAARHQAGPALPPRAQRAGGDPFEQYLRQREIEEHPESRGGQPATRHGDPGPTGRARPEPPEPQSYGYPAVAQSLGSSRHSADPATGAPSFSRSSPGPITPSFGTGPGAPSFLTAHGARPADLPAPPSSYADAQYGRSGTATPRPPDVPTTGHYPRPDDANAAARGRHAAPDANRHTNSAPSVAAYGAPGPNGAAGFGAPGSSGAVAYDAQRYPAPPAFDVPPPPPPGSGRALDVPPAGGWGPAPAAPAWSPASAPLGPPRLPDRPAPPAPTPTSWEQPDWQAAAADQTGTMATYDPDATQLHRAPGLDAPPAYGIAPDFEATQLHRAPDPDATQLHAAMAVPPDLESPTEMIPPDRLGLAQQPQPHAQQPPHAMQAGFDVPPGATGLNGGGFGPPGFDAAGEEDDDDGLPPRPHRVVKAPRRRRPRWVRVIAWSGAFLGVLVVAVGGWGLYEYRKINHNIQRVDALAPNDPSIKDAAKQHDAENFLLIGSDTRDGANARYGADKTGGQRSDTTILAHLSPDRQHAIMVSFPRDSWVTIPDCVATTGTTVAEHDGMFNSAFETGGANCTIRTVQRLTGIAINHYVQVDFSGFKAMVDAIGGVPINACGDAYDKDSGLRLHTGVQTLHGEQALSFVRARHNLGDGSDLDRIKRQQAFLGAMMRIATSNKIILNPIRLTRFLEAASKSVTLDRQTSLGDLRQLAGQLQGLDPKRVTFLTAPIANRDYDPTGQKATGGGRVLLDAAQGNLLWQSIINDRAAPKNPPKSATPGKPQPEPVTVSPEQVSVKVLNGVGIDRLAGNVASRLGQAGFNIAGADNSTERPSSSLIRYAPANRAAALTLFAAVPGSVLQADSTLGQTLQLVLGRSYSTVRPVTLGQQVTVISLPGDAGATANPNGAPPTKTIPSPQPSINAGDSNCIAV